MPRASIRTPELEDAILARLEAGETLSAICRDEGMPSRPSFLDWIREDPLLSDRYARARLVGFDALAEETIAIADTARIGEKTERKEISRQCTACQRDVRWLRKGWSHSQDGSALCEGAEAAKIEESKVVTGDMVERARLQVDTRKWLLGKLYPHVYGDKLAVTGADGGALQITMADQIKAARKAREDTPGGGSETD